MNIPIFPIFETDLPGYNPDAFDGRALGEAMDALEALCEAKGLTALDDFHAMTDEEAADLLESFNLDPANGDESKAAIDQALASLGAGTDPKYLALQKELKDLAPKVERGDMSEDDFAAQVAKKMAEYFMGRFGDDVAEAPAEQEELVDDGEYYETAWHDAAAGLEAISAIRLAAETDPAFVQRYPEAVTELREMETYVQKAAASGIRFAIEHDV